MKLKEERYVKLKEAREIYDLDMDENDDSDAVREMLEMHYHEYFCEVVEMLEKVLDDWEDGRKAHRATSCIKEAKDVLARAKEVKMERG